MRFNIFAKNKEEKEYRTLQLLDKLIDKFNSNRYGSSTQAKDVDRVPAVNACLRILSENMGRVNYQVVDKDNQPVNHNLNYILNTKPNSFTNANDLKEQLEYRRNQYGNAFALVNYNSKGNVEDIQIIEHDGGVIWNVVNGQMYVTLRVNGQAVAYNYSNLIHVKVAGEGKFPESPLKSLYNTLSVNKMAQDSQKKYYENNAIAPFAITPTSQYAGNVEIEEVIHKLIEQNMGALNAGKPVILPANCDIKPLSIKFIDAQLIETFKFTTDQIASTFGIPNYLINNSDSTQKVEEQALALKLFTIDPIAAKYEEELSFKLLTPKELKDGLKIKATTEQLIEMDYNSKASAIVKQVQNGIMTRNQASIRMGNGRINDPTANKHIVQSQMVEAEKLMDLKNEQ